MMSRLIIFLLLLMLSFSGCGDSSPFEASSHVGTFKSYRTSNGKDAVITITEDDGGKYVGQMDGIPIKGEWGKMVDETLGIIVYRFDKGADVNFIDFYLKLANTEISGSALRQ